MTDVEETSSLDAVPSLGRSSWMVITKQAEQGQFWVGQFSAASALVPESRFLLYSSSCSEFPQWWTVILWYRRVSQLKSFILKLILVMDFITAIASKLRYWSKTSRDRGQQSTGDMKKKGDGGEGSLSRQEDGAEKEINIMDVWETILKNPYFIKFIFFTWNNLIV